LHYFFHIQFAVFIVFVRLRMGSGVSEETVCEQQPMTSAWSWGLLRKRLPASRATNPAPPALVPPSQLPAPREWTVTRHQHRRTSNDLIF